MSHKIAKLLLEHAETFLQRKEAVHSALQLGMPLGEIEEYLDWLDAVRRDADSASGSSPRPSAENADDGKPRGPSPPQPSRDDPPSPSSSGSPDDASSVTPALDGFETYPQRVDPASETEEQRARPKG